MNRLKVGIAGFGIVGKRRKLIIDTHPDLVTHAVCDVNYKNPEKLDDGTLCFTNYQELLKEPLDILFVCLPNYISPEVTIAGLEKGLHVFCEKPPGRTPEDIQQVIEAEKKCPKQKLKYGFNHRYHDSVKEALRIIQSGDLGEIINLRGIYGKSKIWSFASGWRAERKYSGGGILLDQGIHMLDLMRLFCGEFTEVKSFITNEYWKHDVEDNAYAIMRDEKGRVAMMHSSATQWQHRFALDITFREGYIELRGILTGTKSYGEETLNIGRRNESDKGSMRFEQIKYLEDNSWRDEIYEFADSILNGSSIIHGTSTEALKTMELVYRIYKEDFIWNSKIQDKVIL